MAGRQQLGPGRHRGSCGGRAAFGHLAWLVRVLPPAAVLGQVELFGFAQGEQELNVGVLFLGVPVVLSAGWKARVCVSDCRFPSRFLCTHIGLFWMNCLF